MSIVIYNSPRVIVGGAYRVPAEEDLMPGETLEDALSNPFFWSDDDLYYLHGWKEPNHPVPAIA